MNRADEDTPRPRLAADPDLKRYDDIRELLTSV